MMEKFGETWRNMEYDVDDYDVDDYVARTHSETSDGNWSNTVQKVALFGRTCERVPSDASFSKRVKHCTITLPMGTHFYLLRIHFHHLLLLRS